ncbi:hypothetical protein L7F22_001607 [Adiantum nelumboides]|nr:hypothetical protein [Adiantum nelumboides]
MSSSLWLSSQRSEQQHKPYHSIFRSATPPPPRSRSAAATNSPIRGRHVIPRSHSVLHARPASAPRISTAANSPSSLDQHRLPIVGNSQADLQAQESPQGGVGIGSHVHVDYSAIQRIADGVEQMVRSWTSENSCRAQVYAKAYDSLHPAVARGKDQAASQDQHQPPQDQPGNSSTCTDRSPFKLNPNSSNMSSQLLAVHNLQSPADPNLVEMAPCIFDMHDRGGDTSLIDNDVRISTAHQQSGSQTPYGGLGGSYNVANSSTTGQAGRDPPLLVGNGELLYTEGSSYPVGQDAVKKLKMGNNICAHNDTHNYPIRLNLIHEDDDIDQNNAGSIANLAQYSHSQLDNFGVEYDGRELASLQHGGGQQGELAESAGRAALHLQQQFEGGIQLQSTPFLLRNDVINSNSLIRSNYRSRSPRSSRLGALSNTNASNSLEVYHQGSKVERRGDEKYQAKVKELEISLLECATEYEVQLVEMKMKMLQMKSEFRQKSAPKENKLALCKPLQSLTQKYVYGLTIFSFALWYSLYTAYNYFSLQECMFVWFGNTLSTIDCVDRLLSKKEQELLNSKLREKELAGQVDELQSSVQRGRVTQMEPKKLLSLLLALIELLQSVKAGVLNDDPNAHRRAYQNVHALAHLRMNLEDPQNANRTSNNVQSPRLENLAAIVNKEIKTLQEILGKLTPHRKRIK